MKKHTYLLLACLLAVAGVLLFKHTGSSDPRPGLVKNRADAPARPAGSPGAPGRETAITAVASQDARRPSIPMVDRNNPEYTTILALLSRSFTATLKNGPLAGRLTAAQLKQCADELAVIRLSQTMYEATIAEVTVAEDHSVAIRIPVYGHETGQLQQHVFENLLPEYKGRDQQLGVARQFDHFGAYPQSITVKVHGVEYGEKFYSILHQTDFTDAGGTLRGNSIVSERQLGRYAPFAGWFPKS
ncbi:MAG TPA: hypothetical protein VHN79_04910 [Lacunisphaera sp.]|nr:hypothetical protein [Lacunisphaera sp.]